MAGGSNVSPPKSNAPPPGALSSIVQRLLIPHPRASLRAGLPRAEFWALVLAYTVLATYATKILQIPVLRAGSDPGYIHIGDMVILIAGLRLGVTGGALVGAVGSALADVLSPDYAYFAPLSFVAHGLEGAVAGLAFLAPAPATVAGEAIMLAAYFVGEIWMFGEVRHATSALPLNVVQACIGVTFGLFLFWALRRLFGDLPITTLAANPTNDVPDSSERYYAAVSGILATTAALLISEWKAPVEMLSQYTSVSALKLYAVDSDTLVIHIGPIVAMVGITAAYLILVITLFLVQVRFALWLATLVPTALRTGIEFLAIPIFVLYMSAATIFFQALQHELVRDALPSTRACVRAVYTW